MHELLLQNAPEPDEMMRNNTIIIIIRLPEVVMTRLCSSTRSVLPIAHIFALVDDISKSRTSLIDDVADSLPSAIADQGTLHKVWPRERPCSNVSTHCGIDVCSYSAPKLLIRQFG
jgi:hypothetical protein